MSEEVSVALNSNLGPAAPSDHFPIAEPDIAGQNPDRGHAWAFSVAINLPAAASAGADLLDQAKQAITRFLKPVEENGSLRIVKSIVARFNRELLLQQSQPSNSVLVDGYVQLLRDQRQTAVQAWLPPPCKWTVVPGGLHGTTDFQRDILEAQEPWIIVPVFGAIGMNNAGRQNSKVKSVARHFLEQRCDPYDIMIVQK